MAAVASVARGEASGLETLYDRHATAVYSLALRIVRDTAEAEDVTQEVFAQAWSQAARYDTARGAVVAWLLMMARSRALDRLAPAPCRAQVGPGDDVLAAIPDPGPSVELTTAANEQARTARAALASLPAAERHRVGARLLRRTDARGDCGAHGDAARHGEDEDSHRLAARAGDDVGPPGDAGSADHDARRRTRSPAAPGTGRARRRRPYGARRAPGRVPGVPRGAGRRGAHRGRPRGRRRRRCGHGRN